MRLDPFLPCVPGPQILSKFTKNFTLFSKIVKLSSKFEKFWYQIYGIGPIFASSLENFENITNVYTRFCTDRRLILQPISAARPQINLCTKNPLVPEYVARVIAVRLSPFAIRDTVVKYLSKSRS